MSTEHSSFTKDVSSPNLLVAPGAADYDAIFAAVMETERGRWFLAEYARQNCRADTGEVLAAIERLAAMMRPAFSHSRTGAAPRDQFGGDFERLRTELADMATAIARTKDEIATIHPDAIQSGRIMEATEQLDSVMRTTERATSDILAAAEQVQEVAWTMREQGMESEFCDRLDGYATEIYTACSFQDLTGQRTRKIIQVLRYLEARIQAMTGIWGAASQMKPTETTQADAIGRGDDLNQKGLDRLAEARREPRHALPAVKPPVIDSLANVQRPVPALPTLASAKPARTTITTEGLTESSPVFSGHAADPEVLQEIPAFGVAARPAETDPLAAGLRAFAASLMAEYQPKETILTQNNPLADANPVSSAHRQTRPVPAPPTGAIEPLPGRQADTLLPLAVAPPLADPPQRPAPEPVRPTQKSDIAEELFADVMALTDAERIALFT